MICHLASSQRLFEAYAREAQLRERRARAMNDFEAVDREPTTTHDDHKDGESDVR